MYHPKKNDAFYYSIYLMQFLHYYPSAEDEKSLKCYYAVSVILRLFSSFVLVECIIHLTLAFKNQVPVDISEDIVGLTGLGNSMVVCILFEVNAREWSRLFRNVTNTSQFGTPKNMTKVVKKANRFSLLYCIYCCVGLCIYVVNEILNTGQCERLNKKKGLHEICGTVTPLWWPNEEIGYLAKIVVIFCQVFSAAYYVPPSATVIFVSWEAAEIIIAKIHHLKQLFENAFDCKDKDLQRRRLNFCIRYHQEIIRLAEDLNKATRKLCGQLSCVAAIILSCLGTQMLKEYSIGALIHLMGYGVAVFLVCQTGQKVRDETYDIQDAVYASKWYNLDPKLAKDTQFILLRCQKPVYMEAIPFGIFNYNLLIIILKTSYSYLTLINKTTEETD